jgi:hypothetical protein
MSIHPFLTNLEDEISVKGVGFVRPKIGRRKKHIYHKIKKSIRIYTSFGRIFKDP